MRGGSLQYLNHQKMFFLFVVFFRNNTLGFRENGGGSLQSPNGHLMNMLEALPGKSWNFLTKNAHIFGEGCFSRSTDVSCHIVLHFSFFARQCEETNVLSA